MFYVIGSRAFNHHFPGVVTPKDLDLIGTESDFRAFCEYREDDVTDIHEKHDDNGVLYKLVAKSKEYGLIECEIIRPNSSAGAYDLAFCRSFDADFKLSGFEFCYAPVEMQYSIKLGHIYRPINWEKHILQFHHLHNRMRGVDKVPEITAQRSAEVEKAFGRLKTPSLKTADKENFFLDSIEKIRVFEHDEIHRVMAYEHNTPMFQKMQPDLTKVACSKEMWDKMTFEDQCACVLEEAFVIALERLVLPYMFIGKRYVTEEEALKWALMRICTTLCSGWFRKFARDNYFACLNRAQSESSYVDRFLEKFEAGDIKRIDTYKKFQ